MNLALSTALNFDEARNMVANTSHTGERARRYPVGSLLRCDWSVTSSPPAPPTGNRSASGRARTTRRKSNAWSCVPKSAEYVDAAGPARGVDPVAATCNDRAVISHQIVEEAVRKGLEALV